MSAAEHNGMPCSVMHAQAAHFADLDRLAVQLCYCAQVLLQKMF